MSTHRVSSSDGGDAEWLWLDRYFSGECTLAERARIEQWIAADPARVAEVAAVRAAWAESGRRPARFNADGAWRQMQGSLGAAPDHGTAAQLSGYRRVWHRWTGLAAAALLIAAVGLATWRGVVSQRETAVPQAYATVAGERRVIRLPDGTQCTLAPASRLTVGESYARASREVSLDGEAYFAVVHDSRHPFSVLAKNITVTDVGTEFDVRAYDDEIRVAVAQGAVTVGAGFSPPAVVGAGLRPGGRSAPGLTRPSSPTHTSPSFQDIALFAGDMTAVVNGIPTVTHRANIVAATAWMQGTLAFDKTPFREVVRDISRLYGVSVTVTDSTLLTRRITATLTGESLDVVLDVVTQVVGARFERTTQGVVIHKGLPAPAGGPRLPLTTARAGDMRQ